MNWCWGFICGISIFTSGLLYSKTTVCLNMIVKNEAHVIERALASVRPFIDYWVIVDTGSTDGTQEVIKAYFQDVPGELYERPWKNFGYNRMEALELARDKGNYLVILDADDWFEYESSFKLPSLEKDAYYISTWNQAKTFSYLKPHFIKSSLPWKWEGVMHEYLICNQPYSSTELLQPRYIIGGDGARSRNPQKYLAVARILEEALEDEPNNVRYMFYLAESYRDAGLLEKAIDTYKKRVQMGDWVEEVFWSLFQVAQLKQKQNYPLEDVIQSYYKAHRYRPHRCEPIYYLAEIYNIKGQYDLAYACIKGWQALPKPLKKDVLFSLDWIEQYGVLFQLSIASYYVENYQESLDLNNTLLKIGSLPEYIRDQAEKNREFPLRKLSDQGF